MPGRGCECPEGVAHARKGSRKSRRGRASPGGVAQFPKGLRESERGCASPKGSRNSERGSASDFMWLICCKMLQTCFF